MLIAAFGDDTRAGLLGVSFSNEKLTVLDQDVNLGARGWTFQEGLLASRRLAFTAEQVYFECWNMNRRESLIQNVDVENNIFAPRPGFPGPGAGGGAILETIAFFTERALNKQLTFSMLSRGLFNFTAALITQSNLILGFPFCPKFLG